MTVTECTVTLDRQRVFARHGVLDSERVIGNDFLVTVTAVYDAARAIDSDDVTDAVDYSRIAALVDREMAIPSALLEHVAGRIARAILAEFPPVTSGSVTVTKIHPPMAAQTAGASVTLSYRR